MIRIREILLPLDVGDYARHAVPYARELAAAFDAGLHLLHVVDAQWVSASGGIAFPQLGDDLQQRFETEAGHTLAQIAADLDDLRVTTAVRIGAPHVQIVQYAREIPADLIVLATHGRSGLQHALIGSVAEKVVQMAPCPVLTVKNPEHEFVMP